MSKLWLVCRVIGFFVLIGLLIFGGMSLFNAGWAQGLAAASTPAAVSGGTGPAYGHPAGPYGMHSMMAYHGGLMGFGFGFGLLHLFIFLLLVFLAFRLIFHRHPMGFGPQGYGFGEGCHHGSFHHYMKPPTPDEYTHWYQNWDKSGHCECQEPSGSEDTPKNV